VIRAGFAWEEAILTPQQDRELKSCLVSLFVEPDRRKLQLIGAAFIVQAEGSRAPAIIAAHCMEAISRAIQPHPPYHVSALPEFLPAARELDLSAASGGMKTRRFDHTRML
jgi:hypothetical protein